MIIHPTLWSTDHNKLLHLVVIARLIFIFTGFVRSSIYYDSRGFRIINIYGIRPENNFIFSFKALVNKLKLSEVIVFYIFVVILYSHCLFLVSDDRKFIDCFEIVIVTLPTVGFGDYQIV